VEDKIKLHTNIIYKEDKAYKIIETIPIHNFQNSDNTINAKVLGMYVHEKGANHVLQHGNYFLICETIKDAQVI
jgi:hypothetical protein